MIITRWLPFPLPKRRARVQSMEEYEDSGHIYLNQIRLPRPRVKSTQNGYVYRADFLKHALNTYCFPHLSLFLFPWVISTRNVYHPNTMKFLLTIQENNDAYCLPINRFFLCCSFSKWISILILLHNILDALSIQHKAMATKESAQDAPCESDRNS